MNYFGLLTFSFFAFVASCLPIRGNLRASVYSADIVALIGVLCMMAWNPRVLYQLYGDTVQEIIYRVGSTVGTISRETVDRYVNLYVVYGIIVWFHLFPIYLLRSQRSFGNPLLFLIVYGVLFSTQMKSIYGITVAEAMAIVAVAYLGWIAVVYAREGASGTRAVVVGKPRSP